MPRIDGKSSVDHASPNRFCHGLLEALRIKSNTSRQVDFYISLLFLQSPFGRERKAIRLNI
eukprot:6098686-Pyramimonas_sp.AAC.1